MADTHAASPGTLTGRTVPILYAPGWIDRLTSRIDRLPGPVWLYYLAMGLICVAIEVGAKWIDGTFPFGQVFPFHVAIAGIMAYELLVYTYLADRAGKALDSLKPIIKGDPAAYDNLRYRFTTIPAHQAVLASGIGIAIASAFMLGLGRVVPQYLKFATSPLSVIVDYLLILSLAATGCTVVYSAFHQLVLVHEIYTNHTQIDVFKPGSLYVLSGFTVQVAIAFLIPVYVGFFADPVPQDLSTWRMWEISRTVAVTLLAVAIFLAPLAGVHHMLEAQKRQLLDANGTQLESAIAEVHRKQNSNDLGDIVTFKYLMDSLTAEQAALEKLRTWPWYPETMRLMTTALLLPVILYIVERAIQMIFEH